jgi:hypothetical protein
VGRGSGRPPPPFASTNGNAGPCPETDLEAASSDLLCGRPSVTLRAHAYPAVTFLGASGAFAGGAALAETATIATTGPLISGTQNDP